MLLENKVAVVTGASRGIGRAIALAFAAEGAKVVVNYATNDETARSVLSDIRSLGGEGILVKADVSRETDVDSMVSAALEAFGTIDILVNNAGITHDDLLIRMTPEIWDKVMNIDLKGVYLCTRAVTRVMIKKRKGRIINIASVVGITGNAGQANYSAAKAGVIGFTKAVAAELASRNITVNAIAPGFISTDMTDGLPETTRQNMLKHIPMGRFGTPEDVANAAVFLASEKASYITGQTLTVDGGMVMR